jgi:hypothetical protein
MTHTLLPRVRGLAAPDGGDFGARMLPPPPARVRRWPSPRHALGIRVLATALLLLSVGAFAKTTVVGAQLGRVPRRRRSSFVAIREVAHGILRCYSRRLLTALPICSAERGLRNERRKGVGHFAGARRQFPRPLLAVLPKRSLHEIPRGRALRSCADARTTPDA